MTSEIYALIMCIKSLKQPAQPLSFSKLRQFSRVFFVVFFVFFCNCIRREIRHAGLNRTSQHDIISSKQVLKPVIMIQTRMTVTVVT